MLTKKSPLYLKNFVILDSSCKFTPFAQEIESIETFKLQCDYPVDIDFDIYVSSTETLYRIVVDVLINAAGEAGYSIHAKGAAFFSFEDGNLPQELKEELLLRSGVSICISSIRAYIAGLTAYYPMGCFLFQSIDMVDLLQQKEAAREASKQAEAEENAESSQDR